MTTNTTEQVWPLSGRYARAREAQSLLFDGDVAGSLRKVTISREWVEPSPAIAELLHVTSGTVFRRVSRTLLDDQVVEETTMYFPAAVIVEAPGLETNDDIKVVHLIEQAGHRIAHTSNQIRVRKPTVEERDLLATGEVVYELTHVTRSSTGQPLEAVVNVKPADGAVLTFETIEG